MPEPTTLTCGICGSAMDGGGRGFGASVDGEKYFACSREHWDKMCATTRCLNGLGSAPAKPADDPDQAHPLLEKARELRDLKVVKRPPTCADLECAIVEHFSFVEKVLITEDLVGAERLVLVTAVLRGRPVGVKAWVEITIFVEAQLQGWIPALPPMRVLCSTYDRETGELGV